MSLPPSLYVPGRLIMLAMIAIILAMPITSSAQSTSGSRRLFLPLVAVQPSVAVQNHAGAQDRARELEMLRLINEYRSASQLPPLTEVTSLTQAARRHARDMADHDLMVHVGTDGTNGGQRMEQAGYAWTRWSENIGWEFSATRDMVNWWMNSSPHRAVILSPDLSDFGGAYAFNGSMKLKHTWVVTFGRR